MEFEYDTKEHCYNAVSHSGSNLKHVPMKFMDSKICELAVTGFNGSGQAIRYIPSHFQNIVIILKAMGKYKHAYQFIDPFFKVNRNLSYIAAKQDKGNLKYIPDEHSDIRKCFEFIHQMSRYDAYQIMEVSGITLTENMYYKIIRDVYHDFQEISSNPVADII
jgi:hypothetical protein